MIDPYLFTQWVIAMGVIILTPGPDTLLIMRNAANSGRGVGFATVLGVQTGLVFHTCLALVGITSLVAGHPFLIIFIGIAGALFIAYLAWQTWTAGFLGGQLKDAQRTTGLVAFRDAFLTNALNPKVILAFFVIMLPKVSGDFPEAPQIILMGLAALTMNTMWQGALVLGFDLFFKVLTDKTAQRWINRTVAIILFILAILLPFQAIEKARSDQVTGQESSQPSSAIIPES